MASPFLAVVQLGLVLNLIRGRKVVQRVYSDSDRLKPLTPPAFLPLVFYLFIFLILINTHTSIYTDAPHMA